MALIPLSFLSRRIGAATVAALLSGFSLARAVETGSANWAGWRGDGSGASLVADPPTRWSADTNVAWRAPLAGQGNSSPIVRNGRIVLTSSEQDGRKRNVVCLDAADGHLLWQRQFDAAIVGHTEPKNGYASSTCVSDASGLYAFFDSPGLIALDFDGHVRWQHALGPFNTGWGLASSPVIYKQLIILACDQEKGAFIAAFDKATGEERWRTKRDDQMQFSTPRVISFHGEDQLVLNGQTVTSYAPTTGEIRWTCRGMTPASTPTAQYQDDLIWVTSGRTGPAMSIDPSGAGDVTDSHVRMRLNSGGCYITSPLCWHHGLLLPGDDGHLRFVNASGAVVAKIRVIGHFSASPVLAADRVYWSNEKGVTYVIDLGGLDASTPAMRVLAENDLGERTLASPALCGNRMILRTDAAIYCLSESGGPVAVGNTSSTRPATFTVAGTTRPIVVAAATTRPDSVVAGQAPATLTSLRAAYASHPGQHGDNVDARLDAVETASHLGDPGVISFLLEATHDDQWDVSTLAAKALAHQGAPAADALVELLKATGGQGYLNVIAADALGDLRFVKAVPSLIERSHLEWDASVRISSLRALAKIADADGADRDGIFETLLKGLSDKEGAVREAAVKALVVAASSAGVHRAAVIKALDGCATDKNQRVVAIAKQARATVFRD